MSAATPGRIGPNAIIQLALALPGLVGATETQALFAHAGLAHYLRAPPQQMVDEQEVRRLHRLLHERFGATQAGQAAREAGRRTGDYLLAHRIPKPVQALLKLLPARWAARALLAAIARNAWTFVGSGQFLIDAAAPVVRLSIRHNPMCLGLRSQAPACDFYASTFERLFRVLVHADARVVEVACETCGADACRFEIAWSAAGSAGGRRRPPAQRMAMAMARRASGKRGRPPA